MKTEEYFDLLIDNYIQYSKDLQLKNYNEEKDLIIENYNKYYKRLIENIVQGYKREKNIYICFDEFFDNCNDIIEILIKHIEININCKIDRLKDKKKHFTNEQWKKEAQEEIDIYTELIEDIKLKKIIELNKFRKVNDKNETEFDVTPILNFNLSEIKGCRYAGIIKYSHILEIKKAINEAMNYIYYDPRITIKSVYNIDDLNTIRKGLIYNKIISDINIENFEHHFDAKPMLDSVQKIRYLSIGKKDKPNKAELYYLISLFIGEVKIPENYFNKIAYSFIDNEGNNITLNRYDYDKNTKTCKYLIKNLFPQINT